LFRFPVEGSLSLEAAARRFLSCLHTWTEVCKEKYESAAVIDDPDQALFMTAWEPYLQIAGDSHIETFLANQRDLIRDYFVETEQWAHGYWRFQDGQGGTEHFNRFLNMLARLKPRDVHTRAQILDAAEHLGNWVEEVPAWFDWERGLFRSVFLGTEEVGQGEGTEINIPDHLRMANLALLAYRISNRHCYLDLAAACAKPWCKAILQGSRLPFGLLPDARTTGEVIPLYSLDHAQASLYRPFFGPVGEEIDPPRARAEAFLAADGVQVFLQVWRYVGKKEFLHTAERLLDVLVGELEDPDAGAAADAVRTYWRMTGRDRYNGVVLAAVQKLQGVEVHELSLAEAGPRLKVRPGGVGKGLDMLIWQEDGLPRRCSPILLALAAEMTADERLAARALDLGYAYFKVARQVLLDGRSKASSARTISAVSRGSGRENHAGVTTAVLKPILETFFPAPALLLEDAKR
jgi:hypothetical protein